MKWGTSGGAQNATVNLTFYAADVRPGANAAGFWPVCVDAEHDVYQSRFRGRLVSIKLESNDFGVSGVSVTSDIEQKRMGNSDDCVTFRHPDNAEMASLPSTILRVIPRRSANYTTVLAGTDQQTVSANSEHDRVRYDLHGSCWCYWPHR
jgi:hypothetical protein